VLLERANKWGGRERVREKVREGGNGRKANQGREKERNTERIKR
jgi:hypothetical protein